MIDVIDLDRLVTWRHLGRGADEAPRAAHRPGPWSRADASARANALGR